MEGKDDAEEYLEDEEDDEAGEVEGENLAV